MLLSHLLTEKTLTDDVYKVCDTRLQDRKRMGLIRQSVDFEVACEG